MKLNFNLEDIEYLKLDYIENEQEVSIKLALKELYYKKFNEHPILLLDDIFAALDQKRINHIMAYINSKSQTFITTTSIFNIPDELLKNAKVIRL